MGRWRLPISWPSTARPGRGNWRCSRLSGAGADVLVDDLADAKIVERINAWVRRKTRDLIPSILEEAPETLGLVAVNALYFKDKWQTPFDPARTRSEQFQLASGKPVDAQMMHSGLQKFGFRQDDRFIATELPYATEDFKLVVVTTKSSLRLHRILPRWPAGSAGRISR